MPDPFDIYADNFTIYLKSLGNKSNILSGRSSSYSHND